MKFEIELDEMHVQNLKSVELKYLEAVLALVRDNKTRAARLLGISRKTLYRKLGLLPKASVP